MKLRGMGRGVAGALGVILGISTAWSATRSIEIRNHQPSRFHMPLRVNNVPPVPGGYKTVSGRPVQQSGDDVILLPDLPANSTRQMEIEPGTSCVAANDLALEATSQGVVLKAPAASLGRLTWGLVLKSAKGLPEAGPPLNFASSYSALPLEFRRTVQGPLFDTWSAEYTTAGLILTLELDAFHDGYLDVRGKLRNESAETTRGIYAAVVCRWEQPEATERSICYDNRRSDFSGTSTTSFRAGEGHHLALQRGVDWIRTNLAAGPGLVWLNDFSESFAVRTSSPKRGARWINGNQPQLGQEIQSAGSTLYLITELTRPVTKRYADRFAPYVLPMQGDEARFESRLVVSEKSVSDQRADQTFVVYTCYKSQTPEGGAVKVEIGVPYVKFGTSYFPYSTLGENFGRLKLPGQDREGYWPLSADVVNNWRLFADDIRRDLRILKAMGFAVIRLHHLELLYGVAPEVRSEFLDFYFNELKALKLKALLDVQMKPEEVADLVARYRAEVDAVEVENEVLIWGINEGREKYWNAVYDAVKAVAPEMPVHMTAHSNVGIFNKLEELGGRSDRIGFHSYVDSLDAIKSARGMALAVGNYAGEVGKPAAITEWNWRFLTRIPFEERAKLYPEIIGKALETRSISEFHQFQSIESLAMNPELLRGIRHYEPIFLSRRPKPEAFELMKLIDRYGDPLNSLHQVDVSHEVAELDGEGKGRVKVRLHNRTAQPLALKVSVESFGGLEAQVADLAAAELTLPLQPDETAIELVLKAPDAKPGFYHYFLRIEGEEGLLRYGWGEARLAGKPKLDLEETTTVTYPRGVAEELNLDLSAPATVVYGQDAAGLDVELAILVAQTLESATGRPVGMYELGRLPSEIRNSQNLILIGSPESNALIGEVRNSLPEGAARYVVRVPQTATGSTWLILGGATSEDAEEAAVDFVLRYWRYAKDSASERIGPLVEKKLPKGSDPTKLP